MTTGKFEEYQVFYEEIKRLSQWIEHAAIDHVAPITEGDYLPNRLSKEIQKTMLEMAKKQLAELKKKFELI